MIILFLKKHRIRIVILIMLVSGLALGMIALSKINSAAPKNISAVIPSSDQAIPVRMKGQAITDIPAIKSTESEDASVNAIAGDFLSVSKALKKPLVNSLADRPGQETVLTVHLSFSPLLKRKFSRLMYQADTTTLTQFINNDQLAPIDTGPGLQIGRPAKKELIFKTDENYQDRVTFTERVTPAPADGDPKPPQPMENERILAADGRYLEKPTNQLKKYFHDIDPELPPGEVHNGSHWTQQMAADPRLNPGGQILAEVEMTDAFEDGDAKFARIHRNYQFKSYRPNDARIGESNSTGDDQQFIILLRVDELWDLNVETGVIQDESIVQQFYYDHFGGKEAGPGAGMLITLKGHDKLVTMD